MCPVNKKPSAPEPSWLRYSPLLILLLTLLLHLPTARLGFVYLDDDILVLSNHEKLSHISNVGQAFRSDAFFANMSPYYRPMMNVSFMVDAMAGGTSPAIYHTTNAVLHALACVSLFWLLELLGFSRVKAFAGAVLFSIHPMMGHAVNWIPARGDLLVALFGILSFGSLIRYIKETKPVYLIAHSLSLAAALFSKESAVLFPFLFIGWFLLKKVPLRNTRTLFVVGSWLMIYAGWFYLRTISIDHRDDGQLGFHALLKNMPFLPEAVARFFFPFGLPVTPVFSAGFTLAGIGITAVLLGMVVRKREKGATYLMLFGMVWFLSFCFPNMYVRLESANDSFEYLLHRTYLPYIGFLIVVLALLPDSWIITKRKVNRWGLGVMALVLSVTTVAQQAKYQDAISYWGSAIRYAPEKAWFHYFMGRYYFKLKDNKRFGDYLRVADSLKTYPEFRYQLGMVAMIEDKDYDLAYRYFSDALKNGYGGKEAHDNFVGLCIESSSDLFKKGMYEKAISRCKEALTNDPGNAVAAYNLGIYLVTIGEKQRAASMWRRALHNKPDMAAACRSLCLYYQYDVKKADSAAWFAREFKKLGGTGELISPQ